MIAANSACTITASVKPMKIGAINNTLPASAITTTNAGSSLTTANDPQDLSVLAGQTSSATPVGFQA